MGVDEQEEWHPDVSADLWDGTDCNILSRLVINGSILPIFPGSGCKSRLKSTENPAL